MELIGQCRVEEANKLLDSLSSEEVEEEGKEIGI